MKSTFELVRPCPATGTLFLVRSRRPRARYAADRAVARVVEGVVRNVVRHDVVPDVCLAPVCERLDFPDPVPLRAFELSRQRTRRRLVAPDACDPGIVRLQRLDERFNLADVTAAIGVSLPEI